MLFLFRFNLILNRLSQQKQKAKHIPTDLRQRKQQIKLFHNINCFVNKLPVKK